MKPIISYLFTNNNSPDYYNIRVSIFLFILAFIIIFTFNYQSVYGLQELTLDDNARYLSALTNGPKLSFTHFPRSFMAAFFKYFDAVLLLQGVHIARSFYLFVYTIPLAFLTYLVNRECFNFGAIPAYFSAILISVLPWQGQNPLFIDGNSVLVTLTFLFLSLYFLTSILKEERSSKTTYAAAIIFTALAGFIGSERFLLISPAYFFMILIYKANLIKKISAWLMVGIPSIIMIAWLKLHQGAAASTPATLTKMQMFERFRKSVMWSWISTSGTNHWVIIGLIFTVLILVAIFFSIKCPEENRSNISGVAFYLLSSVFSGAPFWFVSKYFSVRYFYACHVLLWSLLIYSAFLLLRSAKLNRNVIFTLFMALILLSGIQKTIRAAEYNKKSNAVFDKISSTIKDIDPVNNAQFYISGSYPHTGQYYIWSSGYLAWASKRPDIRGVIGPQKNFYNPLNPKHIGYSYRMEGLNKELPVYGVAIIKNTYIIYNYYLQWMEAGKRNSEWHLYKRNTDTSILELVHSGRDIYEYITYLKEADLKDEIILWGNLKDAAKLE